MSTEDRSYWLDLFTGTTWEEFLAAGGTVSGFRQRRWKTVQQMRIGDYLLCYLTGISRFIGILEVIGPPFQDDAPIWGVEDFPSRIGVRPVSTLTPETAVPVLDLREQLSVFDNLRNPNRWSGAFRGSPSRWTKHDGEVVVSAIREAEANPIARPVDPAKLARRPRGYETELGPVSAPDDDEEQPTAAPADIADVLEAEELKHTEVQWLLLKLGSAMGLNVWVARNDRSRSWNGHAFTEIPRMLEELPVRFDAYTNRIIKLIDVLWLQGEAIVGAFEIESSTVIYSGLLRMTDLISMVPNISIPLFIVAPDARRDKVIQEVNRPTFRRIDPPLVDVCQYIPFSALHERLAEVAPYVRHLKPDFIYELAESCELED